MTEIEQTAYRDAYAAQAKIAKQRRLQITHVRWRDGHMDVIMERPQRQVASAPEQPNSSRGVAGLLL